MTVQPHALASAPAPGIDRANPLTSVFVWELRRLRATPVTWAMLAAAFLLFAALVLFKHLWFWSTKDSGGVQVAIYASTAVGAYMEIVNVQLLFFGMFLPFLATDAIAREYKQRTHELLMTTPVPSWAFVVGRFLVALLLSLTLAVLMLLALLGVNEFLARSQPTYPPLNLTAYLQVWVLVVLTATVLLTAVSFTLGTLLPRLATPIKVALLIFWVMLFILGNALQDRFGEWVEYINPTSSGLATALLVRYLGTVQTAIQGASGDLQHLALQLQQQPLDLSAWVAPYLGLVLLGLALVACTAFGFQRFRNVMN